MALHVGAMVCVQLRVVTTCRPENKLNHRNRLLFLAPCLALSSIALPAFAATDYCSDSCVELAEEHKETCEDIDSSTTCSADADSHYKQCLLDCPLTATIPSASEMAVYAEETATELWGKVSLVETHTYLHADGDANTYLFAFSTNSKLDLSDVDEAAQKGLDIEDYDNSLYFLEMGARLEQPPIVAYWNGISREQALRSKIATVVEKVTGSSSFTITKRWGTAVLPIYTIETVDGGFWYHPTANDISASGKLVVDTDLRKTDAYLIRLAKLEREWAGFTDALSDLPNSTK